MNNYYTLAIALSLLIVVGVALTFISSNPVTLDPAIRITDATLKNRTIVDFGVSADGTVSYSYLAQDVPELLDEAEVPELRNENSYTKFIEVVEDGEDPIIKLETRFYSQPAYALDVDGSWRYLKYATTTEQAFRNRNLTLFSAIREVFVRTAYADTVSPFSEAGDGQVTSSASDPDEFCFSVWGTARGAADGTTANYIAANMTAEVEDFIAAFSCTAIVTRAYLPFSTGSIPSGSSISSATLNVYVNSKRNDTNDGLDLITVTRTSQATHTTLSVSDFDNVIDTEGIDSGQRKDITSITTSAYLSFTLNATGIGWIAKSGEASNCSATAGISCFGLREYHDVANSNPGIANNIVIASSEDSTGDGDDRDPYLSVTYTLAASAVKSGLKVGAYGSLKVTSGGIKIK